MTIFSTGTRHPKRVVLGRIFRLLGSNMFFLYMGISRRFGLWYERFYYDGLHERFQIGFFNIQTARSTFKKDKEIVIFGNPHK